jgi:hypothetical protein
MINNLGGFNESFKDVYFINKSSGVYFYNNVSFYTEESIKKKFKITLPSHTECTRLIKNHEDRPFKFESNNFVIVRDFLNLICSRYARRGTNLCWDTKYGISNLNKLIECWKQHMSQRNTKHLISYNQWIDNKEYRNKLADILNVPNDVDNTRYVSSPMGGSAFIGNHKEENILSYLQRFKQVQLPQDYIETILKDKELLSINLDFFNIDIQEHLK